MPASDFRMAMDNDSAIPEVKDSQTTDRTGTHQLQEAKNVPWQHQTQTQTKRSSQPSKSTHSKSNSRQIVRNEPIAFNATNATINESQVKFNEEIDRDIEFSSTNMTNNFQSKDVLLNFTRKSIRGRPQTATATGRPAASAKDFARFGNRRQPMGQSKNDLHPIPGRSSCLLSPKERGFEVRNSVPLSIIKRSHQGSLRGQ